MLEQSFARKTQLQPLIASLLSQLQQLMEVILQMEVTIQQMAATQQTEAMIRCKMTQQTEAVQATILLLAQEDYKNLITQLSRATAYLLLVSNTPRNFL